MLLSIDSRPHTCVVFTNSIKGRFRLNCAEPRSKQQPVSKGTRTVLTVFTFPFMEHTAVEECKLTGNDTHKFTWQLD